MAYIPHEKMTVNWSDPTQQTNESFIITLPWVTMEVDVTPEDKNWITEAITHLYTDPLNENVQKFIKGLNEYPVSYIQPRKLNEFEEQIALGSLDPTIDYSTPLSLLSTFVAHDPVLQRDANSEWIWDHEKILNKARIEGTDLYDPLSFVTYAICYRLEWESTSWVGQDAFGTFLEALLQQDEKQFFQAMGWITKQAWYITSVFCSAMEPALSHFSPKGKEFLKHYLADEVGHHKFMEQVFRDLGLDKDDFPIEAGSKWLMTAYKRAATLSPLASTTMVNIFEVGYDTGQESTARLLSLSSKPQAARGFDLHHKINMDHRHCDIPIHLASYLAPQTRSHALLTLGLFELSSILFDRMEQRLVKNLGNHEIINMLGNKMEKVNDVYSTLDIRP